MQRKGKVVPKALAAAREAHDKFLRKLGIDPDKTPKLRGAVPPLMEKAYEPPPFPVPTSDAVPGSGTARRAIPTLNGEAGIAQVYHKGPLMVVSDFKDLKGSKRRD